MKKILILATLICSISFSSCKKSTEETPAPEIAVADANGVIERFNFDGNLNGLRRTNVTFSNPNSATVTGKDRRGNTNRALVVPANASLTIDGLPLVTGGGSRTILCWIHPNNSTGNGLPRNFVSYGANYNEQGIGFSGNNTIYGNIPGTSVSKNWEMDISSTVNPADDFCYWIPVALVYNQTTNKLTFYVWNNTTGKVEVTPPSSVNTTGTGLRIGGSTTATFKIDDLIIYNRALTDSEIQTLLTDGRPDCT